MIDEHEVQGPVRSAEDRGRSLRHAATILGIVGVVFSVLFIVSVVVLQQIPGPTATDAEIQAFYGSGGASLPLFVGLYVMPFAGIAFIWFIVAVRMWVAAGAVRQPTILQSNLQLVSGIAFVILAFIASAASTVVAGASQLEGSIVDVNAARQFPIFGRAVTLFFAVKMAAMYVFTTSMIGRGPGALANWFVVAGFIIGLFLLLSPVFSSSLVLAFPIWVLVLCWFIVRGARRIPRELRVEDLEERPGLGAYERPARRRGSRPGDGFTTPGRDA